MTEMERMVLTSFTVHVSINVFTGFVFCTSYLITPILVSNLIITHGENMYHCQPRAGYCSNPNPSSSIHELPLNG